MGERAIRIEVNGAGRSVVAGASVEDLVRELDLRPELVAVEVNRRLVRRAERAEHRLEAGDAVEIVTLVGGG